MRKLLRRLNYFLHRARSERELEEEMAGHQALMPEGERRRFGNPLRLRERSRESWGWTWADHVGQDLAYAWRGLLRNRRFAFSVIAALALPIGAATAVFSVVDRSLFRPLPYAEGERLVTVALTMPSFDTGAVMFLGAYRDWTPAQKALDMAAWSGVAACDLGGEAPLRLQCARMEAGFLPLLGVTPAMGRNFDARDDGVPVALVSHAFWVARFGGSADAVGKRIPVDGVLTEVIGVLPRSFETPDLAEAQLFLPRRLPAQGGRNIMLEVIGRLRPGVSLQQARAELRGPLEQFRADFGSRVGANFAREMRLEMVPLRERQTRRYALALWMLLGAVAGFVLIGCANVTNLLLARAAARRAEFALRTALGASRARLLLQMLVESGLLCATGALTGLALAGWLLRVFVSLAPDGTLRMREANLDARVLAFTLMLTAGTALVLGLAPMLEGFTRGRWLRPLLVMGQVAVSFLLLTGAGLFLTSLWKLQSAPTGIRPERVVTAGFTLPAYRYGNDERQMAFFAQLEERLRGVPGAGAAALADSLPPGPAVRTVPYVGLVHPGGNASDPGMEGNIQWRWVSEGYFAALGIAIRRGRGFQAEDRDAWVDTVVINETLARRVFGGEDAVGRRIGGSTVIGVAADVRNLGPERPANPEFYRVRKASRAGMAGSSDPAWPRRAVAIVRTRVDGGMAEAGLRRIFAEIDPGVPVQLETMEAQIGHFYARARFQTTLLIVFAMVGLALAGIGIYGLIAFLVAERTREIGVRIALGATAGEVSRLVVGNAVRWSAAGLAAGVLASWFFSRLLQGLLYEVRPSDPRVHAGALVAFGLAAAVAAWIPARRAARIDPMVALRHE